MLDQEAAQRLLAESFVAHVEWHDEIGSTNDRARQWASSVSALGEPVLIVADQQTQGRGRGGNRWWTGRGALAASLLFDPARFGLARELHPRLSLATGVALVDVVSAQLPGQLVGLHWPNDVYAAGRKIAGILLEGLPDGRQIAGFGLNVNNRSGDAPQELQAIVATMCDLAGREFDRVELLIQVLQACQRRYEQLARDPAALGRQCDELCLQHGEVVTLELGQGTVTGVCRGVALDGALVLATPAGLRSFYAGALRRL
ncbi:MAG: biotin--[acetyl-CoA-carboxylase] ligase [Pirellulales bacterium]|nr:biotin--[acetyl-CoA-carboxylase] ligase [Pirellulales bacterium]